jgi:hypothetical protein
MWEIIPHLSESKMYGAVVKNIPHDCPPQQNVYKCKITTRKNY